MYLSLNGDANSSLAPFPPRGIGIRGAGPSFWRPPGSLPNRFTRPLLIWGEVLESAASRFMGVSASTPRWGLFGGVLRSWSPVRDDYSTIYPGEASISRESRCWFWRRRTGCATWDSFRTSGEFSNTFPVPARPCFSAPPCRPKYEDWRMECSVTRCSYRSSRVHPPRPFPTPSIRPPRVACTSCC